MPLTIVMYHYVRDLERSRYPGIKGRTLADFKGQLDHIGRHFDVVTVEQVLAAAAGRDDLPQNACWLTFDDGYLDHFVNVFPLLDERGWQASFFPPARTVLDGRLLDVNKIHFILAAAPGTEVLLERLRAAFEREREGHEGIEDWDHYRQAHARECHLDTPDVLFVKQMLQVVLPEPMREAIADALFAEFVSADEAAFAAELYMSTDQLAMMARSGMVLGSHGYSHQWMNSLGREAQEREIDLSLRFLQRLGVAPRDWVMCYPYGGYNETTLEILAERGCGLGITTRSARADLSRDRPLELPRVDTNELPTG